ncbi:hypothetical protein [Dickeya zeae]|uniref:hypothetical protein n=1 Tax=Dickeya zeae TaxID=204042 RepID=UPI000D759531|nr:hypothetical protein [Dickeya zeae]PXW46614.1 hypothetical protein DFO54_1042 [Erwinia sp. AG740]UJR63307.1 hypothetical protein HJ586_14470 [Dickeya zeae]
MGQGQLIASLSIFFTKNCIGETDAINVEKTINDFFKYLKLLDVIEAFNTIELVKLKGFLNYSDYWKLHFQYTGYLKYISSKHEENNFFYITRMVLDLRNLKNLNVVI